MIAYNLYYNHNKINSKPLSKDTIDRMKGQKFISKKIDDNTVQKFLTKDIRIVECIIV